MNTNRPFQRLFSVAPMMDCTDRHYRQLMRCISSESLLYTEMVTANAVVYGDHERLLGYGEREHPIALQLGGSDPKMLAEACKIAEQYGYDEVNLNVGCPSDRVQSGQFGACLMKLPDVVSECFQAMQQAVSVPITIKTRLGVDEFDSYDYLHSVIERWKRAGCDTFLLHARKAWLKGLSPKENRDVPPLQYDRVYRIKREFPGCHIGINGGIKTIEQCREHLQHVDEVMIGREAYSNPYVFAPVDREFYHVNHKDKTVFEVVRDYMPYIESELSSGAPLLPLLKPLIGLFQGFPGARLWRRTLSEHGSDQQAGIRVVERALEAIST